MTIYRYPFAINDEFVIEMHAGAKVLSVRAWDGEPCVWALVNSSLLSVERRFALRGTGQSAKGLLTDATFVGTFKMGALVFHLFDRGES
jgi:hypothetical protein